MWYRNPRSEPIASKEELVYRAYKQCEGRQKKLHIVAGKPEPGLYAELTVRDKDEKTQVKIFTVSLGIKGQEASEMPLPGIMPETLE